MMDEINDIGPGDPPPGTPVPPKNYQPLNVSQRGEWNSFLDYVGKQKGIDLDKDPSAGVNLLNQYKKTNPNSTLTPDHIAAAQYEQYQLRKGDKFGNLTAEQLKYVRQGLPEAYLNRPIPETTGRLDSATAKLYYPQITKEGHNWGTDVEGYVNGKATGAAPPPVRPQGAVPLPNYEDPKSRIAYLGQLKTKYGAPLMQGRGDTPIHVNEVPDKGILTMKESSTQAASKLGLDPALLYASTMEEGASGRFPGKDNAVDESGSEKYPVDGFHNYGLDNFHDNYKTMVQRGYLPKDFDYEKSVNTNESKKQVNSANFKTDDDAMMAKAAYIRMEQDNLENWAKKEGGGVELSPQAKQFFTLIAFNGGPGRAHTLINYYKKRGLLAGDKYLQVAPDKSADPGGAWGHVVPRVKMAEVLKKEGLFE